jgi:hypothetical protein
MYLFISANLRISKIEQLIDFYVVDLLKFKKEIIQAVILYLVTTI